MLLEDEPAQLLCEQQTTVYIYVGCNPVAGKDLLHSSHIPHLYIHTDRYVYTQSCSLYYLGASSFVANSFNI